MGDFDAVLERLLTDQGFATALAADPARALAGYRLTPDEVALLHTQVGGDTGGQARVEVRANQSSLFGMLSPLGGLAGALSGFDEPLGVGPHPGTARLGGMTPPVEGMGPAGGGGQGGGGMAPAAFDSGFGHQAGAAGLGAAGSGRSEGLGAAGADAGLGSVSDGPAPGTVYGSATSTGSGTVYGSPPGGGAGTAVGGTVYGSAAGSGTVYGSGVVGAAGLGGLTPALSGGLAGLGDQVGDAVRAAGGGTAALGATSGASGFGSDGSAVTGFGSGGSGGTGFGAAPVEPAVPEGYRTRVDVDGDGHWDRHRLHGRADGGVDIVVDRNRDGRADFVGHDLDGDGLVDYSEYDKNHDGFFEKRMYDDNGDGWMDRGVRVDPADPSRR